MNNQDGTSPGDCAAERRPDRHRDGGFTFVEVVVTIVLVGVVIIPILATVRSSISAAAVSRAAAEVETVLVNAVDGVNNGDPPQIALCDFTDAALAGKTAQGWADSTIAVTHQYLQADGTWSTEFDPTLGCPAAAVSARPDGPVLLIRITVTHPTESVTRPLEVVKGEF